MNLMRLWRTPDRQPDRPYAAWSDEALDMELERFEQFKREHGKKREAALNETRLRLQAYERMLCGEPGAIEAELKRRGLSETAN